MDKISRINHYVNKFSLHRLFQKDKMPTFELIVFEKGDVLLKEYKHSDYLYFIVEGSVKIFTYSTKGKLIYISQNILPFQILGETASLWGWPPVANVQARSEVTCLAISLSLHRNQLLEDTVFLKYIGKKMAERIQKNNTFFLSVLHTELPERLAFFILNNAHKNVFSLSLTETAEVLGTSYRHLIRCLNVFYKNGYLEKTGRKIKIMQPEKLEEISRNTL